MMFQADGSQPAAVPGCFQRHPWEHGARSPLLSRDGKETRHRLTRCSAGASGRYSMSSGARAVLCTADGLLSHHSCRLSQPLGRRIGPVLDSTLLPPDTSNHGPLPAGRPVSRSFSETPGWLFRAWTPPLATILTHTLRNSSASLPWQLVSNSESSFLWCGLRRLPSKG